MFSLRHNAYFGSYSGMPCIFNLSYIKRLRDTDHNPYVNYSRMLSKLYYF